MTDGYYAGGSGKGVIADASDRRSGGLRSWNRWQGETDAGPADGVAAAAVTTQDPAPAVREATPTEEGGGDDDGFVPSRRSQNSKRRRRRGGGRHRIKERRWSRGSRSRGGRGEIPGGGETEAEPDPQSSGRDAPQADARAGEETPGEPDHERAEPIHEPATHAPAGPDQELAKRIQERTEPTDATQSNIAEVPESETAIADPEPAPVEAPAARRPGPHIAWAPEARFDRAPESYRDRAPEPRTDARPQTHPEPWSDAGPEVGTDVRAEAGTDAHPPTRSEKIAESHLDYPPGSHRDPVALQRTDAHPDPRLADVPVVTHRGRAPEARVPTAREVPARAAPSPLQPTRFERPSRVADLRNSDRAGTIDQVIASGGRTSGAETTAQTSKHVRPSETEEPVSAPKRSRGRLSTWLLVVAVIVASAVTAWALVGRRGSSDESRGVPTVGGGGDLIATTLIAGVPERGGKASWLTLLSHDRRTNEGAVVYIPAHTAVEVPGRGLQGVGDSLSDGDAELLVLSAKSLLNVEIDHYLELTPGDAEALLAPLGSLTIDVPGEVRINAGRGTARLLFPAGAQELSPRRAVELLYTVGLDDDELDMGPRHLAFWDALYDTHEDDSHALAAALAGAGEVGRSDVEAAQHVRLIASLAGVGSQGRNLSVLPVQPVSVGDSELYSIQEEELAEFMTTTARAEAPSHDAVRVQVLNGNGYPGIGQEVASRLLGKGFRVVLSGNARKLNQGRTLIVTYDSSPAGIELAETARDLVGVGEVQVSRLDQGIVDLTVVVGKDFLRKP